MDPTVASQILDGVPPLDYIDEGLLIMRECKQHLLKAKAAVSKVYKDQYSRFTSPHRGKNNRFEVGSQMSSYSRGSKAFHTPQRSLNLPSIFERGMRNNSPDTD